MSSPHEVAVRRSGIEGLGVFTVASIPAGERIHRINVLREVTAESPLRPELGERADHCDYPDGRVVLLGPPDEHLNHSCDPNAYVQYEGDASFLVARRDIEADREITCDYSINLTGGSAWACHCGSTRCRGTVVGDFFALPPELQQEYRPLLAAWFVRRHADRLADPRIALLLRQLQLAFDMRSWHGSNLRGSLRGVDPELAGWRPGAGRHNIAELVVHAAYWKYRAHRLLSDTPPRSFELPGSDFFERPAPLTRAAWRADIALLQDWHVRLATAVAGFPAAKLGEMIGGGSFTYSELICGAAAHDLYHAGQIQLIKRFFTER